MTCLRVLRNGAWLEAQDFPPLRYAVPGLAPEGFTLLIGPPKVGKSWLILDMLLAVAAGGRALGAIDVPRPRRVLYLALEDGDRRMKDRCHMLRPGETIPATFDYLTRLQAGQAVATIDAYLEQHPDAGLIVVDTLGKVMPPAAYGESAYQRDYRIGSSLKRVADDHPGVAVVVLHHDRKAASEDFVDSVSGTHGLAGAADTIVVLSRQRQAGDGLLKVTGRDVAEGEYAVAFEGCAWTLRGDDLAEAAAEVQRREESAGLGDVSLKVIDFVRRDQRHPHGVKAERLSDAFGENVHTYLKRLVDSGRLVKSKRGWYHTPQWVSEPSEPSEDQVTAPPDSDARNGRCGRCGSPCASGTTYCDCCEKETTP
ncbi:MAG: AAA family ATPase [Stackebrandtia sp.]